MAYDIANEEAGSEIIAEQKQAQTTPIKISESELSFHELEVMINESLQNLGIHENEFSELDAKCLAFALFDELKGKFE